MRVKNEEEYQRKKNELMEKCFDSYAEYGPGAVDIKELAKASGCTSAACISILTISMTLSFSPPNTV